MPTVQAIIIWYEHLEHVCSQTGAQRCQTYPNHPPRISGEIVFNRERIRAVLPQGYAGYYTNSCTEEIRTQVRCWPGISSEAGRLQSWDWCFGSTVPVLVLCSAGVWMLRFAPQSKNIVYVYLKWKLCVFQWLLNPNSLLLLPYMLITYIYENTSKGTVQISLYFHVHSSDLGCLQG